MTNAHSQQEREIYPAKSKRGGRLALAFYRFTYRHGRPRWDSSEPHRELVDLAVGRPPGRAVDLGCGTGTDVLYLAQHGWDVVGVDFVPEAVETARKRAVEAGLSPQFVLGDVTRLRQAGVEGPFDLIMDTGCYHGIAEGLRHAYAAEVTAVAAPGADFFVAGISDPPATWRLLGARGVSADDLLRHFGTDFDLTEEKQTGARGRVAHFGLYHLVRRENTSSEVKASRAVTQQSQERNLTMAAFVKVLFAGPLFFVSSWILMIFAGSVYHDVGIRPFGYVTAMVVTIGLWLTVAPAIGAIAGTSRRKSA